MIEINLFVWSWFLYVDQYFVRFNYSCFLEDIPCRTQTYELDKIKIIKLWGIYNATFTTKCWIR